MKGSFRKRGCKCPKGKGKKCTCGATWSFRLSVTDPVTGERKQPEFGGYRTKAEAEEACADMITKYTRGELNSEAGVETVEGFMRKYIDTVLKHDVQPHTLEQKVSYMNNYIVPELGRIKLQKLTPMQVQSFINGLTEKNLSPGSIRNIMRLLNQTINKAMEWGYVTRNVVGMTSKPNYKPDKPTTWTKEQFERLLKQSRGNRFYPYFLIALTTGMRPGEICALSWEQIDLKAGKITVDRTMVYTKDKGLHIKYSPKTSSSSRVITVPKFTQSFLLKYKVSQVPNELNLVITNTEGNLCFESVIAKELNKEAEAAGLPLLTPHGLRHTHATYLLSPQPFGLGQSVQAVSERLGHAKNTTTWNTYAHVLENMQTSLAETMDDDLNLAE